MARREHLHSIEGGGEQFTVSHIDETTFEVSLPRSFQSAELGILATHINFTVQTENVVSRREHIPIGLVEETEAGIVITEPMNPPHLFLEVTATQPTIEQYGITQITEDIGSAVRYHLGIKRDKRTTTER